MVIACRRLGLDQLFFSLEISSEGVGRRICMCDGEKS